MGMFDKDKEIGLIITRYVDIGEEFILWDARIIREDFPTKLGLAVQSELVVSKLATPAEKYTTTTLASAIGAKVKEAEKDDFPAVCSLAMVDSRFGDQALVVQFLKPFGKTDARPIGAPAMADAVDPDGKSDIPY